MNSLFFKKNRTELSLAIDIESNSVSAGLFETSKNGMPKFMYVANEFFRFSNVLSAAKLLSSMARSLDLVLLHTLKYGLSHLNAQGKDKYIIGRVAVSVSSPWHISEIKTISLTKEIPFIVTESQIKNMVSAEEKDFESRFGSNKGANKSELELIDRKIVTAYLNDYQTETPFGKKASKLEIVLFTSISERRVMAKIRDTVARHFPNREPFFHNFILVAFAGIRDVFPESDNFILVQIGGEVTDIAIAKAGKLAEVVSFPLGHSILVRSLDMVCKNSPSCELETLIKLFHEDKVKDPHRGKIKFALADAKLKWTDAFNEALSNFSGETFLPKNIFLICGGEYGKLFEDFLKTVNYSRFTLLSESFKVTFLGDDMIDRLVNRESGSVVLASLPLVFEADFMIRFGRPSN